MHQGDNTEDSGGSSDDSFVRVHPPPAGNTATRGPVVPRQRAATGGEELRNRVLDVVEYVKGQLLTATPVRQMALGGVTGCIAGCVVKKVGKAAALGIGGAILVLQVASYKKLIKVDWNKVKEEKEKLGKTMSYGMGSVPYAKVLEDMWSKNRHLTGGFMGGFLLGLAA